MFILQMIGRFLIFHPLPWMWVWRGLAGMPADCGRLFLARDRFSSVLRVYISRACITSRALGGHFCLSAPSWRMVFPSVLLPLGGAICFRFAATMSLSATLRPGLVCTSPQRRDLWALFFPAGMRVLGWLPLQATKLLLWRHHLELRRVVLNRKMSRFRLFFIVGAVMSLWATAIWLVLLPRLIPG